MTRGHIAVLVVGQDPEFRRPLELGLPRHLQGSTVVALEHVSGAMAHLAANQVDVLVIDLSAPALTGFELLAHVRAHHRCLPVVALSDAGEGDDLQASLPGGRVSLVPRRAAVSEIAKAVREARGKEIRGHMRDVELAPLLRLLSLERTSCTVRLRSGERKGLLYLIDGALVDAYSFDLTVDGEPAARQLLAWDRVTVDVECSTGDRARRIELPLEALLLDAARLRDEALHAAQRAAGVDGVRADGAARPDLVVSRAGAGGSEQPDGADSAASSLGARIDAALAALRAALADLRTRLDSTKGTLQEAAPSFERLDAALRGAARADEEQLAGSWRELAAVTERLARAAEALAAPSFDKTT